MSGAGEYVKDNSIVSEIKKKKQHLIYFAKKRSLEETSYLFGSASLENQITMHNILLRVSLFNVYF